MSLLRRVSYSAMLGIPTGVWFGGIFGVNLGVAELKRPCDPFTATAYVVRRGAKCSAMGAAICTAAVFLVPSAFSTSNNPPDF